MPSDFFYPGIPTGRQNTAKTKFTNDDLVRPSLRSLYDAEEQKRQEQEVFEGLQQVPQEPSVEALLSAANDALEHTRGSATNLRMAERRAMDEAPASAEALAPRPETTYKDVAEQTAGALGFLPGPVGMAARLASSGLGAYDLATEGPTLGNVAQTAFGLLEVPGIARSLRGPATVGPVAKTGEEIGARVSYPRRPATSMQIRGELPISETPQIPSAPLPYRPITNSSAAARPSIAALADDSAGVAPEAAVMAPEDLTGALDNLVEAPLSPAEIARSRAAERFGRTFRSERTNPRARYAGQQEALEEGMPPTEMFHTEVSPGQFSTGATADEVVARGMTPDDKAMERIIAAAFGENPPPSVSRMTAQRAVTGVDRETAKKLRKPLFKGPKVRAKEGNDLVPKELHDFARSGRMPSAKDEPLISGIPASEWNDLIFGGVGGINEAGEFVRPSARTPIGR